MLSDVKKLCRFVLAVTTSPRAWVKTSQVFSGIDCIAVGLGLHPEILADRINERDLFMASISKTRYIGEVGLDGTAQSRNSLELQIDFFTEAIRVAEKCGGRILSIHSRSAVKSTLDVVEKNVKSCVSVMHWFSGTEKELDRAISLNCWFSINPRMLFSNKGISLIRKVSLSKMVPETDGPFTTHDGNPYMPWETDIVVESITQHKGIKLDVVEKAMAENVDVLNTTTKILN
jgi:TatD DNase family protein